MTHHSPIGNMAVRVVNVGAASGCDEGGSTPHHLDSRNDIFRVDVHRGAAAESAPPGRRSARSFALGAGGALTFAAGWVERGQP
jgi:hypothetical protein